ncbi:MAG: outer membrane protein assembly factor BamB family protein [Candidatus Aquicultorales bacterium]
MVYLIIFGLIMIFLGFRLSKTKIPKLFGRTLVFLGIVILLSVFYFPSIYEPKATFVLGDGVTGGNAPNVKWTIDAYSTYDAQRDLAIDTDGNAYIGWSGFGLLALNPDGTKKWLFKYNGVTSPPTVGPGGTVYFTTDKGVYAVSRQGKQEWFFKAKCYRGIAPVMGDSRVYIVSKVKNGNTELLALRLDGHEDWRIALGGIAQSQLAVDNDGTIYAMTEEGTDLLLGMRVG